MARVPILSEFERDRSRMLALIGMIRLEIEQLTPPVHERGAARIEQLLREIEDLDLWFKLGLIHTLVQFITRRTTEYHWRAIMHIRPRATEVRTVPLLVEGDPVLAEHPNLLLPARSGWRALDATLQIVAAEVEALADLPSRIRHGPLIDDIELTLSDDRLFRSLLTMRFQMEERLEVFSDYVLVDDFFRERQLMALVSHCMPGFGPLFDVNILSKQGVIEMFVVACSPVSRRAVRIPINPSATSRTSLQHVKTLQGVIDEMLIARARDLGTTFDPTKLGTLQKEVIRRGVPEPSPDAVQQSIQELRAAEESTIYTLSDVARLLGIEDPRLADMKKSTKYVQQAGVGQGHQLPKRVGTRRAGPTGKFESDAEWTRDEVLIALRGWAKRLGVTVNNPF